MTSPSILKVSLTALVSHLPYWPSPDLMWCPRYLNNKLLVKLYSFPDKKLKRTNIWFCRKLPQKLVHIGANMNNFIFFERAKYTQLLDYILFSISKYLKICQSNGFNSICNIVWPSAKYWPFYFRSEHLPLLYCFIVFLRHMVLLLQFECRWIDPACMQANNHLYSSDCQQNIMFYRCSLRVYT